MLFFSRKRRNKKTVKKPVVAKPSSGVAGSAAESHGYDPYDTVPGRPRDEFGMRRRKDGKWTF